MCVGHADDCGDPAGNFLIIFLIVEAILFGLFTSCMILDQWGAVQSSVTSIDRLKGEFGNIRSSMGFLEVFGGNDLSSIQLHWFLPIDPEFTPELWDSVFMYEE
eukprot:CAMPEP_0113949590 /NCGR_PEP_ID=MMETSP1339-20121228/76354_1 /TAXON_ID=94617 /ORGANISM="Fibrocapsa japonica" /LENGTH=103 /DNA_ID=CAMNT_0000957087 /DNA_START=432 /DNA_END=743 /DNA_ORIENTATION=+ /assembly_acc=CAM_ASM_000762